MRMRSKASWRAARSEMRRTSLMTSCPRAIRLAFPKRVSSDDRLSGVLVLNHAGGTVSTVVAGGTCVAGLRSSRSSAHGQRSQLLHLMGRFWAGFALGGTFGIGLTLFTSLLTELIALGALAVVVIYIGRKRWRNNQDTPSTTKKSPFESL